MWGYGPQREDVTAVLGVEELSVTVPDLEQASAFFVDVFGAEVVSDGGRIADPRGSTMREYFNCDVRAEIRASRRLRTPFLNLRLVEAAYPGQRRQWPGMLDIGGWHLAGYVDDMDAAVEALESLESSDVHVLGPGKKPTTNPPEVGDGSYACHCMTSWGFHFELTTYPNGRAYMEDYDDRLWNPAEPDAGATDRAPGGGLVPGFRGFEHLSFSVPDIAEATSCLEEDLGFGRFYDMGPVADPYGSGFGAYANVDVRVRVSKVRLFRTPFLNIEVIEPAFPGQNRDWPGLLDLGGWKLTLAVEDLDAVRCGGLPSRAHQLGDPRTAPGPDGNGRRTSVSFLTPFGLYLDFVQDQAPPASVGPGRAWNPAAPHL
jgi:catechol 2,3-dioxygenase-like lactoylglutathione lyase family enzyme